jgi:hypothetical protein
LPSTCIALSTCKISKFYTVVLYNFNLEPITGSEDEIMIALTNLDENAKASGRLKKSVKPRGSTVSANIHSQQGGPKPYLRIFISQVKVSSPEGEAARNDVYA